MTLAVLEMRLKPLREPAKSGLMQFLWSNLPPQPIKSAAMHKHYSQAVRILLEALQTESFSEADRETIRKFAALVAPQVAAYEKRTEKSEGADGVAVLEFLMAQHGLTQADLAADLGGQSVVSDLLNGKRMLNVEQISRLSARFGISPASFFPAA
ncbi:MAG: transcriptional regulator [Elusimicrobia bacterium]|nr:MAG: transcriptional regulator [Elusimicrobiota bacterium]